MILLYMGMAYKHFCSDCMGKQEHTVGPWIVSVPEALHFLGPLNSNQYRYIGNSLANVNDLLAYLSNNIAHLSPYLTYLSPTLARLSHNMAPLYPNWPTSAPT